MSYRLRNYNHASLYVPAEYNLTDCFPVRTGDITQERIVENVIFPFRKRCPCLQLYVSFPAKVKHTGLLGERMTLNLIHHRFDL